MAVSAVVQVVACDSGLVGSHTRSIAENRKLVRVIIKKEKKKLTTGRGSRGVCVSSPISGRALSLTWPEVVVSCH